MTLSYLEKAINILLQYFQFGDGLAKINLDINNPKVFAYSVNDKPSTKCLRMKVLFILVKCCLQTGAVLSQQTRHEEALNFATTAHFFTKVLIFNQEQLVREEIISTEHFFTEKDERHSELADENPYLISTPQITNKRLFKAKNSANLLTQFKSLCGKVLHSGALKKEELK